MSKGDPVPVLPADAPTAGEVYRHYKGGDYKVHDMVFDTSRDVWAVLYEPLYEIPGIRLCVRPLSEWEGTVQWEGKKVARFAKQ
jgi:hypothetical protein